MKFLLILNDAPYGTERCYNGLRLASALVKKDPATEITIFGRPAAATGVHLRFVLSSARRFP